MAIEFVGPACQHAGSSPFFLNGGLSGGIDSHAREGDLVVLVAGVNTGAFFAFF